MWSRPDDGWALQRSTGARSEFGVEKYLYLLKEELSKM